MHEAANEMDFDEVQKSSIKSEHITIHAVSKEEAALLKEEVTEKVDTH